MARTRLPFAALLLTAVGYGVSAQTATPPKPTPLDDAPARADLVELREKYDDGAALDAQVTLTIQFPEQPAEVQTGRIRQAGEKFHVTFEAQEVISDGETVWMYLPDNQEVQVYDVDEEADFASGGMLSPQQLLTIYDSDGFEYAVVGEINEDGRALRQIEFKPTDRDSEFAKIRLTYDPLADEVARVNVFSKDGSRFALELREVTSGGTLADEVFTWDAAGHPGVSVEDMRL